MPRRLSVAITLAVAAAIVLSAGILGARSPWDSTASTTQGATPALPTSTEQPSPSTTQVPAPAVTPASVVAAPTPGAPVSGANRPVVLGYYVPYDATSWVSFQAQASGLDYLGAQWVNVDACGNLSSKDDRTLVAYANQRGVKVLPSLLTSSAWLGHRLLTDPATSERYISQIVGYVTDLGYAGLDLDMEGLNAEDRDAFSAFVTKLAAALHERGKILTMAIPAKTTDVRTGWAGPYDYSVLGKQADLILLMTYDFSWSSGPPGSIAPQGWVDKVATYAASQMPPQKVLIGLAFYGYDWNTTSGGKARAVQYTQSVALAKQYSTSIATDDASRSGSFRYTSRPGDTFPLPPSIPPLQHDIAARSGGQCTVRQPTPEPTPSPTPVPTGPQQHIVWLEGAESAAGRIQIAAQRGLGGIGAWRLGQEDPGVWPLLGDYRLGKR